MTFISLNTKSGLLYDNKTAFRFAEDASSTIQMYNQFFEKANFKLKIFIKNEKKSID